MLLIVFLAAPTTKIYLDQRAEIIALERSIQQNQASRDDLEHKVSLWDDSEYVRQQARQRLMLVDPGQRSYMVVGADDIGQQAPRSSAVQEEADNAAWADAVWESVLDAAWPQQRGDTEHTEHFPQLGGESEGQQNAPTESPTVEGKRALLPGN